MCDGNVYPIYKMSGNFVTKKIRILVKYELYRKWCVLTKRVHDEICICN